MKELLKRWLGITTRVDVEAAGIIEAKQAHISDLRVLLDRSTEREQELAGMIRMVMEERFYRPQSAGPLKENKIVPIIPHENLQDVVSFEGDQERVEAEGISFAEAEKEFSDIMSEHQEAHS